MTTLKAAFALAVLVCATNQLSAAQPNWVAVTPGNGAWLDVASIKRVDGKLLVWFVHDTTKAEAYPYARPGVLGTTFYKSTTTLYSIDCKAGNWATLQVAYYTEERMTGEFLGSSTTPDNAISFSYPIPGTVGSSNVDFVCGRFGDKK